MKMRIVSLCLGLFTLGIRVCPANPIGGTVVGGDRNGTISGSGTPVTTINQHGNRIVINWQDFSIGPGEITRFIQPSATSWALNRVISGNPSLIYGSLQANGHVLVINQNGIMVSAQGKIDTKGFVASTLDVRDSSFMKGGTLTLSGSSTAGVRNDGTIQALGGDVFLIGNTVENSGTISAPQGTVGLAAGSTVRLVQSGNERISVLAGNANGNAANGVNNIGTIEGASAELKAAGGNIYALAINNQGAVRASSVVREGGHVYLRASGGNIQNSGTISANKADGSGGTVIVDGGHNADNASTVINSGTIAARGDLAGTKGGKVEILGDDVRLVNHALVDVSGDSGGGTALIGGDFQGLNPAVRNSQFTTVEEGAEIHADATHGGDAGKVVVWSDNTTHFDGAIYARALGSSGDGGVAEISGHEHLGVGTEGHAYLAGANGEKGQLLLDPGSVTINHEASGNTGPNGNLDTFFDDWLVNQLNTGGADVAISTANSLNGAAETLTVNNNANISWNSANSLALFGRGSLTINASATIANAGSGGLTLQSSQSGASVGDITVSGTINMVGNVTIAASGNLTLNNDITAAALDARSGTDGIGNLAFAGGGSGITINANSQSYRAGNGSGTGLGGAAIDFHPTGTDPSFRATGGGTAPPTDFTFRQDHSIAAADFPAAGRFGSALPASFTAQSDGGSVTLPAMTLPGTLQVSAAGAITENAALVVAGNATFAAGANDITLDKANNFSGTVAITSGNNVTINDINDIDLGASTISGNLTVTAAAGNITDSGAVNVTGNADFTSGLTKTIVLDSGFSVAGTLGLHTSGAGGNATVVSGSGINLANSSVSGSLSVTAGGDITQSGTLTVLNGPSTFAINGVTANVLLGSQANNFGNQTVTITATGGGAVQDVSFRNTSLLATVPVLPTGLRNLSLVFNNAGVTLPGLTLSGNLSVTAGGDITESGALLVNSPGATATFVAGGNNITLDTQPNDFGTVAITSGNDVRIGDINGLNLGASTVSGNLTVTAGGNITESGALNVSGVGKTATFTVTGPADVLLAGQQNNFRAITVSGPVHNLAIENINASAAIPVLPPSLNDLTLIFDNAAITLPALTLSGNLIVNAGGDITQIGPLQLGNPGQTASFGFVGTPHNIVLNNTANDFNTVAISSANDVTLVDANRINLGASTISGNLNVSALNGPITQTGPLLVNGVGKTATFSAAGAGNDIILTDSGNDFTTVSFLSAGNVNIHDINALGLGASSVSGNLFVNAGGAISQSGALNIGALASFATIGSAANGNITLNDSGNNFGSLALSSANGSAVSVTEAAGSGAGAGTLLDTVAVNGDLTIHAGGAIGQVSGQTIAVGGLADFTSDGSGAAGEIVLANSGNNFGSLGLHSANGDGVVVLEAGSTALDTVSVPNGIVLIVSGGDITQVGGKTIFAGGNSLFEAPSGNSILINNGGNTFNGTVSFASTTTGNLLNVAVANTTAFDLGALTLDGSLTVNAGGPITQSGTLNVAGLASFNASGSGANGNITLNDAGNNFGSLGLNSANGSAVQVTEASATALDNVAVNGTLSIISGGDITQVAGKTIAVGGNATFASVPGASVLLGNAGNVFGSPVNFVSTGIGNLLNVTVQNNGAFNIQGLTIDGNLNVTANGAITDSGAIRVGGTTTLAAGSGNDITLDNADDFVGAVDIVSAKNVTLNDINSLTVGGTLSGDLSTVSGGSTTFNTLNVGGLLTVVANGLISDNGNVTVAGAATLNAGAGNDIILDNADDFGGAVSIVNAKNVTLVDINSLTVGGTIGGTLTTTANGATTFNALTVAGNLNSTANALISDNGNVTVGGTTTLSAGSANDITMNNADDFGGPVNIASGHNVTLNDVNSLSLGSSIISGNLNITANGPIFDAGNVTVAGATTLAAGAGNNISFTHADDFGGPVSIVSGNNVFLNDVNTIDLGASTVSGSLTVVAGGDITDSGNLAVANSATFAAAGGRSIILDQSGNTFNGPVFFASSGGGNLNNVTVVDTTSFDIAATTVNGTFSVTAGGPVTQSGTIVAPNLAVTSSGSVTLNSANQVGTLAVDANGTVDFREAANMKLTVGNAGGVSGINSHNNNITISADDMDIVANLSSGSADTLLQPVSIGRNLHFGPTEPGGDMSFTQTELEHITAHTLTIGNSSAGDIIGAASVTKPQHVDIFHIVGGTSQLNVQSLAGQLASFLSGTALPMPRLEVSSFSGGAIDLEEAAKMLPPGSIGTLYLQVPFVPVEEKKYKVEEVSKWTTGRIAASGTTAGPQTPR